MGQRARGARLERDGRRRRDSAASGRAPLWLYWTRPDRRAEGRTRLERVLSIGSDATHPRLRARVVGTLAFVAATQADLPTAGRCVAQALISARVTADYWLEALMLCVDSQVRLFAGELSEAERVAQQALDLAGRGRARADELGLPRTVQPG
jgi:hypothetical protein